MAQQNLFLPSVSDIHFKKCHAQHGFYVVSIKKLIALLALTLGLYTFYWFYRNWRVIKQQNIQYSNCSPLCRSLLSVIFLPSLFTCIESSAKKEGVRMSFHGWQLALVCNLSSIIAIILLCSETLYLSAFGLLAGICGLLPLIKMQKVINQLEHDPTGWANHKFTGFNWLCLVAGASYTSLFGLASVMLFAA